jgi:hypothetical protein
MMFRALCLTLALTVAPIYSVSPVAGRQQQAVYVCPMHPDVQSSKPGKCPKCGMTLVLQKPAAEPQQPPAEQASVTGQSPSGYVDAWTCPMHPELRLDAPGKCPKCGMTLVPATPGIPGVYNMKMETSPAEIKANEKFSLRFAFYEPGTGKQVTQFSPTHTKLFHLFIISQDMAVFQHIHPEAESDGSFVIETVLPQPGIYKVYSDVYPSNGTPQVLQANLITAGYHADLFTSRANLTPDTVLSKVLGATKIDLTLDPAEIIAGTVTSFKFHLSDADTGAPVQDLKPYLGAWGHTLILSEDQVDYVHSHPDLAVPESAGPATLNGGPDVVFNAMLPAPGVYRLWAQFQRGDKLITVSFTLKADELH